MDGSSVSRADAWKKWKTQFNLFLIASGVHKEEGGVQASLLINFIGTDIYQTFTFEDETKRDDVTVVIRKFDDNFSVKVNVTFCILLLFFVSSVACDLSFPPGFKFGAATAAYQVEGAWNVSDKSESIWDRLTHRYPEAIQDGSNGDVACDSYHQWPRDVQICKELGLHFYRFSISWPRLLPDGFDNRVSEDGKAYYNNLIDGLISNGVEPVVTLYHWDLPQKLQDLGGWTNPLIIDWFGDYARVAYSLFGDRVQNWLTTNEAIAICDLSYEYGWVPNSLQDNIAIYLCTKHVVMAHARAYRIYDEEFRHKFHGRVSLTTQMLWIESGSDTAADEELAELAREFMIGRYAHPIFSKKGGWPEAIEKLVAANSKIEGYPSSRLPAFTKEEIDYVRGTYDFIGMNYYTSRIVRPLREGETVNHTILFGGESELSLALEAHPSWPEAASTWFFVNPEGLRHQLSWLKKAYGDIEIIIFENGYSSKDSGQDDDVRVQYYRDHLEQVALSINEDKVKIAGYTAWTMIDNFEWMDGYTHRFGLYAVDFTSPDRNRSPRKSAKYYKSVIQANKVLEPSEVNYNDELKNVD